MSHPAFSYSTDPKRSSAGFTLAELLVVVAIVGVLVAIAIPVFTSQLEKAQEATCEANRRSLKAMVTVGYLSEGMKENPTQLTLDECMASLGASNNANTLCPLDGDYSLQGNIQNGGVVVKCSVHGLSTDEEMYAWVQANSNLWGPTGSDDKKIWEEYKAKTGNTSWPKLSDENGTTLYLKFKSYNNRNSGTFLFASTLGSEVNDHGQWKASYVCDNTGLIGDAGQWYKVPDGSSVAAKEDKMKELLENNKDNKVSLLNGKFVAQ